MLQLIVGALSAQARSSWFNSWQLLAFYFPYFTITYVFISYLKQYVCNFELLFQQLASELCTLDTQRPESSYEYKDFKFAPLQTRWLSPHHSLLLWQHCSLTSSPTALLRMCTVSHQLPSHVLPVLTIQSTAPHSLSMHKKLNCILTLTPLWCSYQVTMFLIQISQLPM